MGAAPITNYNLLPIVVDLANRKTVASTSSSNPRPPFVFGRGDTLKGTVTTVILSGTQAPLYWLVNVPTYELALTNGENIVYASAVGWEALGGTSNPHQGFDLDVSGSPLDQAMRAITGQTMSAFLEIHISGIPASEGAGYPQDQYLIRETATIFKTALNILI